MNLHAIIKALETKRATLVDQLAGVDAALAPLRGLVTTAPTPSPAPSPSDGWPAPGTQVGKVYAAIPAGGGGVDRTTIAKQAKVPVERVSNLLSVLKERGRIVNSPTGWKRT